MTHYVLVKIGLNDVEKGSVFLDSSTLKLAQFSDGMEIDLRAIKQAFDDYAIEEIKNHINELHEDDNPSPGKE